MLNNIQPQPYTLHFDRNDAKRLSGTLHRFEGIQLDKTRFKSASFWLTYRVFDVFTKTVSKVGPLQVFARYSSEIGGWSFIPKEGMLDDEMPDLCSSIDLNYRPGPSQPYLTDARIPEKRIRYFDTVEDKEETGLRMDPSGNIYLFLMYEWMVLSIDEVELSNLLYVVE